MKSMLLLRDEGKFDFIGLSECRAETIRRAAKVSLAFPAPEGVLSLRQVAPIGAVEIEISPMSYEDETKKGKARSRVHRLLGADAAHSHRDLR
jgi:pyridoxine 4-dehydrogenase